MKFDAIFILLKALKQEVIKRTSQVCCAFSDLYAITFSGAQPEKCNYTLSQQQVWLAWKVMADTKG